VNRMVINILKTKEIVFRRPNPRRCINSVPISEIQQITSAKLLGITLCDTLYFDVHIGNVLKMCSQRIYLLKLLRYQGLPRHHLNTMLMHLYCLEYGMPSMHGVVFFQLN